MLNRQARQWAAARSNDLQRVLAEERAVGHAITDLVSGRNPDYQFPPETLARVFNGAMANPKSLCLYEPDPLGRRAARDAIAGYYQRRGVVYTPDRIILTPGTSTAYLYLLSLLCEPGDEILVPRPGYPLFDDLAAAARVRVRHYHLRESGERWGIDLDELAFQATPRTRAVMLVSPHNPTGLVLSGDELESIGELCHKRGLAAVFDEVFCESLSIQPEFPRPVGGMFPLAFVLNGFSKMFALPGVKAAWIAVSGIEEQVRPFLRALEHLSDTFLPNNEWVQSAIPSILETGDPGVLGKLHDMLDNQRRAAETHLPLPAHRPDGGVYLCPRLPAHLDDNDVSIRLLREARVLLHPGYLYGLESHLVMTCLAREKEIRSALARVRDAIAAMG